MSGSRGTSNACWDVVVVGGGHAGIEAALAARRLGLKVLLVTANASRIGEMSCNPAIGGIAKGTLVREIDALGGLMAETADATRLQFRMLNRRKGRAVWGPRVQSDSYRYMQRQQLALKGAGVTLLEDEVTGLERCSGRVEGVVCRRSGSLEACSVVLAAGTFLGGMLFRGEKTWPGGRLGDQSSMALDEQLRAGMFHVKRFKTGTSPRVSRRSIDTGRLTLQEDHGSDYRLSFREGPVSKMLEPCYTTRTTPMTREIALAHLGSSPLFAGRIEGIGPRFCPSFEDKVVRFPERKEHLIFVEPLGSDSEAMYLNGLSTSLPAEVQEQMVRSIPGLERAELLIPGYAVEYGYFSGEEFDSTLRLLREQNLFVAGQICGTSGYEEAAALGLLAGTNAGRACMGLEPVSPDRWSSYLGVMVDDLSSKSLTEPYRLFSSRSENRLFLREQNADLRLVGLARSLGIARPEDVARVDTLEREIEQILEQLRKVRQGKRGTVHCRHPGATPEGLLELYPELGCFSRRAVEAVLLDERYGGYIDRARRRMDLQDRLASVRLDSIEDFGCIREISWEARDQLNLRRPRTLGDAAKLAGVRPTDVDGLLLHLARKRCST